MMDTIIERNALAGRDFMVEIDHLVALSVEAFTRIDGLNDNLAAHFYRSYRLLMTSAYAHEVREMLDTVANAKVPKGEYAGLLPVYVFSKIPKPPGRSKAIGIGIKKMMANMAAGLRRLDEIYPPAPDGMIPAVPQIAAFIDQRIRGITTLAEEFHHARWKLNQAQEEAAHAQTAEKEQQIRRDDMAERGITDDAVYEAVLIAERKRITKDRAAQTIREVTSGKGWTSVQPSQTAIDGLYVSFGGSITKVPLKGDLPEALGNVIRMVGTYC